MKDYNVWALKPGGGLSSLWNLSLLSLTALSRSPVNIYKVPGVWIKVVHHHPHPFPAPGRHS